MTCRLIILAAASSWRFARAGVIPPRNGAWSSDKVAARLALKYRIPSIQFAWLTVVAILLGGLPCAAAAPDTAAELIAPEGFEIVHPVFVDALGHKLDVSAKFLNNGQLLPLQDGRIMGAFNWNERAAISFSTDAGATWTEPRSLRALPEPGVKKIGRVSALQTRDGTIWLFHYGWVGYTKDPATSRSDLWARASTDGGKTWKPPRIIWHGYIGMTQGAIEASGGHILVPICYLGPKPPAPITTSRFIGACVISTNGGQTWGVADGIDIGEKADLAQRFQNRLNGGTLEPSVVQLKDGRIWMVMRTITGYLWESFSKDGGLSWSEPMPTHITCGGPVYITRLKSRRLAMVWNQANWANGMTWGYPHGFDASYIALSDDEGRTWHNPVPHARGGMRNVHSLVAEYAPGKLLLTLWGRDELERISEARLLNIASTQTSASSPFKK